MFSPDFLAVQTMIGISPLMGEPNLIIYVMKPTGDKTTDSVGNKKQVFTTEILKASVRENLKQKDTVIQGGYSTEINLIGRLVGLLPSWLDLKKKYKAEYTANGLVELGQFQFDLAIQNRVQKYAIARGSAIKGIFTQVS